MIALHVTEQYERDRSKYRELIQRHAKDIERVVDLFSRLKSTEQAEEVMTVLFAIQHLKQAFPHQQIAEQQLYDYILDWKKNWRSEDKRRALANAIRSPHNPGLDARLAERLIIRSNIKAARKRTRRFG